MSRVEAERLAGMRQQVMEGVLRGAKRWLQKTVNALKAAAPVATGELRSSIRGDIERYGNSRVHVRFTAPTLSATFTEKGTKAHGINPRRKGALFWTSKGKSFLIYKYFGTPDHPCIPPRWMTVSTRRGRVQRWLRPLGKQGVWAVWHPGTRGTQWFSKTFAWQSKWLADHIEQAIVETLKRFH